MEKDKQKIIKQEIVKVSGQVAYKQFLKVKLLGKGGFANCYLTKNIQTQTLCATKVISKSILANPRTKVKLQNEIKIHKMLHNEYIVKFHTAFEDSSNVYVTMQLCENNTLNDYIVDKRRISVPQSQKFIYELAEGLKYLHSKKVIHRDIKLGNIFLGEKNKVKIGDFGLAAKIEFQGEKKRTVCGTPNYLAPEIIKGIGYGYQVDIWSIGILLFTLLVGTPPFQTENLQQTYQKILGNNFSYQGISVPSQAKDLIKSILDVNPALRPTLDEIIQSDFMKYGKLTILIEPSLVSNKQLKPIQNKQNQDLQLFTTIISYVEIKQGLAYLLSNGSKGLISQTSSMIIPSNKDYISLIIKDKVDKIKKIPISELDQQTKTTKLLLESIKFDKPGINNQFKTKQSEFVYLRKYVVSKNGLCIFRMSNQTVHFKWEDGYYGMATKSMRVFVTDGKKMKISLGVNQEKEMNKTMKSKVGLIKQFINKW